MSYADAGDAKSMYLCLFMVEAKAKAKMPLKRGEIQSDAVRRRRTRIRTSSSARCAVRCMQINVTQARETHAHNPRKRYPTYC